MHFGLSDSHGGNYDNDNSDADDDELIATYNVYASSLLQHQLHIFQFPLRRKLRPYEADEVRLFATDGGVNEENETAPVAQNSLLSPLAAVLTATSMNKSEGTSTAEILHPLSRLTMHCRVDTFGSCSFTEQQQQQQQQQSHSYHYALQSHPFLPRCDYAVGIIADGAIHLTPVASIQQFTPIVKPGAPNAAHCVADAFSSSPSMPVVPGLAISDRITREMLRQRSVMLNTDAASAKELQFFPIGSVESGAMRRRLLSPAYGASLVPLAMGGLRPAARTEDSLFPPELFISGGIFGGEDAAAAGGLLQRYADRYNVLEQLTALLQRAQVLTFADVCASIVPPDSAFVTTSAAPRQPHQGNVADEQLLEALREAAVWIHGVWVSKKAPRFKGTAAALREVVLLHFFESLDGSLSRNELNRLVNGVILQRTIKEILESVAYLNRDEPDPTKRVWRLKHVPSDKAVREEMIQAVQNAHPHEINFQRMQWAKLKPHIMAHLGAINAGQQITRLFLTARRQDAGSDVAKMTGAAAAAANMATSFSFTDEELAPIVEHIRQLFLEHGVLNKQRAKELVIKGKQLNYPDATNQMLSAALQRCVQPFTSATWVLKTLGDPTIDRHRPLILETVLELVNFETRAFHAALEEKRQRLPGYEKEACGGKTGSEEIQRVVPRVLAEVAVFKHHERLWHIKSGNVLTE